MNIQKLQIEQIDRNIKILQKCKQITAPDQGWIKSIRTALQMTLKQLGKRLNITPQSVKEIEQRETNGSISIQVLRNFGECMNMQFIYGFIPEQGSLQKLVNQQATEIARDIVMRTATQMELEDQSILKSQLEKSIKEKTDELIREMPKYLWD